MVSAVHLTTVPTARFLMPPVEEIRRRAFDVRQHWSDKQVERRREQALLAQLRLLGIPAQIVR